MGQRECQMEDITPLARCMLDQVHFAARALIKLLLTGSSYKVLEMTLDLGDGRFSQLPFITRVM